MYADSGFMAYQSGVYSGCPDYATSVSSINHAVVIVAIDGDQNYIVKNSWGTSWGEKGFMKLLLRDGDISNEKKSFFGSHFIIPLVEGQKSLDPELYSK